MSISAGVPVQSSDVLRQSKTSIIVFTSLVCRAAIEGGLDVYKRQQQTDSLDQVAADQQNAQLAETGVDAVVDECQQRVGEAVQNTGEMCIRDRA